MKYYIQRHGRVEGPLTVTEINSLIASGLVDSQWLATSDLGEGADRIMKTPPRDWVPVAEIPGVVGVTKTDRQHDHKRPDTFRLALVVFLILFAISSLFAFLRFLSMFNW